MISNHLHPGSPSFSFSPGGEILAEAPVQVSSCWAPSPLLSVAAAAPPICCTTLSLTCIKTKCHLPVFLTLGGSEGAQAAGGLTKVLLAEVNWTEHCAGCSGLRH